MPKEQLDTTDKKNKVDREQQGLDIWRGINIPDKMVKDAFPALALSILQEYFLSGDTKVVIFQGMLHNLEKMNYSKEEIEEFRKAVNVCFDKFHKPNGFMG